MKSERLPKILIGGFFFALVLYILTFAFIQSCRTSKGPWTVVFLTDNSGTAGLLVTQPKLEISQRIMFPNQKMPQRNLVRAFVFNDPTKTNVPFGQLIFQDLTFLPGTVTLSLFNHEVELLPRVLIIDKKEHAWKKGEVISMGNEEKPKTTPRK